MELDETLVGCALELGEVGGHLGLPPGVDLGGGHRGPGGDEVLVVVRGPTRPIVVRRKVRALGVLWVNGPSARFAEVPGYYAIAGTRPAWQILPEGVRQQNALGLDALPLTSTGARSPSEEA